MNELNPTPPTLFYIELEDVKTEMKDNNPNEEKIEYLKWLMNSSCINEGLAYYEGCEDHKIPAEWRGLIHASKSIESDIFNSAEEKIEYIDGRKQWEIYIKVKQFIVELELR